MKELKSYISEGFFSNIGANNIIKPVIDAIKDASINSKINTDRRKLKFADSLAVILKDLEANMKKGKFIFEYIRIDGILRMKTMISLEILGSNDVRWSYDNQFTSFGRSASDIAAGIATDLYYELKYQSQNPELQHSIAKTIKVIEFKVS